VPEPLPTQSGDRQLLTVQNLEVRYGATQVIWGISMAVATGKVTCIIGSNGAGKTTTLNAIAGVLPAKGGKILLNGDDVTSLSPRERVKRHISLVPEGRQLWPGMSVEENLLMGCFLPTLRKKALGGLERVYGLFPRLKERRRQMAGTLSGGEQQMCAIGRGLMGAPRLLMIDELSLGLSPLLVEQLVAALRTLNAEGMSILLVEQDVTTALDLCHSAYIMDMGRIVRTGLGPELLADPIIRDAYLGVLAD